jgi:outer membrane protein assembly factor BamD (BamD/ComL family)
MANEATRPLKVFLCHASGDKPAVRELYKRLIVEGVDAWLDQEKLLPGQDWRVEIPRAVREADVVVICLSNKSITKEGYVQKEIKFALDSAEEKPEDTIFLIPARLEDCVVPEQLGRWQWVDLFEENGFVRLLRSLKLRADRVGAAIEPVGYENEDQEIEDRLDQLYTEGLAAFYTEDWDKAYQRFQAILRERPNHKNATEKLAQAERQRNVARLYTLASEAYQSENWLVAIQALEELLGKSGDYKDSVQLLANAKKRRQLKELYAEAKRLHAAHKWQAVVKVFEQISIIEPAYPDPEGLLASAQREAAELKRLADLNDLYRHAVHKMDAGEWYEARDLLEQVHKAQTGFLDTEGLLRKVEKEIIRIEELKKRDDQINILYEQAHGLLRSKSWRMALDKMEEIQSLDDQFVDKDRIFEKAKMELEREEQIAQRQNELSAMYAEAVRLLKEGKYQEALEKWQEVQTIDSKYPDHQKVHKIAVKRIEELSKPRRVKRGIIDVNLWKTLVVGLVILSSLGILIFMRGSKSLFFEDFNGPTLSNAYEASLPKQDYQGAPDYSFETLDQASVLRLHNRLQDRQSRGWQISTAFKPSTNSIRLEVRFNTLVQSPTTSIDGFLAIWLLDADDSDSVVVWLFGSNYGSDRFFVHTPFDFKDNTWYHLVITGSRDQEMQASIYDDKVEKELVKLSLGNNLSLFKSGLKIGIEQFMGEPGGAYPTDVAVDWIRLTNEPVP